VSVLLRATGIEGRPVVTLGGERVGDVKDVVFDSSKGKLLGFTLRAHSFFSRARKDVLAWSKVGSLGPDAVMIRGEDALEAEDALAAEGGVPDDRNVVGNQVLTDAGTDLGTVVDVIVETGAAAQIVGYEVAASEALATHGEHVLIPLPDTIAVSGRHLMVPEAALEFVSHDLSGFGAAVESFRAKLRQRRS
jgi:uncharacterized protein YrrD